MQLQDQMKQKEKEKLNEKLKREEEDRRYFQDAPTRPVLLLVSILHSLSS